MLPTDKVIKLCTNEFFLGLSRQGKLKYLVAINSKGSDVVSLNKNELSACGYYTEKYGLESDIIRYDLASIGWNDYSINNDILIIRTGGTL